jgi:hypothetical protein
MPLLFSGFGRGLASPISLTKPLDYTVYPRLARKETFIVVGTWIGGDSFAEKI